jgi:hypothetical protein
MTLRDKRVAFSLAMARLILWANDNLRGFGVAFGEGLVALTDAADGDHDGPHKAGGAHYSGLGMDLVMWEDVSGDYVEDGEHPAWIALGEHWERIDSLARWGGRFSDANHFSFEHEGRS